MGDKMNRREFLKGVFSAAALTTIPVSVIESFIIGKTDTLTVDGITIDYVNKKLIIDGGAKRTSLHQMYGHLKEVIRNTNKPEPMTLVNNTFILKEDFQFEFRNLTLGGEINLPIVDSPIIDMGGDTDLTMTNLSGLVK